MQSKEIVKALDKYFIPGKGFVYFKGCKQPEVEATVWACMAAILSGESPDFLEKSISWLKQMQNSDGSVKINSVCQGQAVWAASQFAILMNLLGEDDHCRKARKFILTQQGETFAEDSFADQDNSIVGWSWTKNSFSWVEPTSWALICLKDSEFRETKRFKDGILLLKNRQIPGKGWNYGNKNVYSTDLIPFIDTTALALCALYNEVEMELVTPVVEFLNKDSLHTDSLYALALAIISLTKYGSEVASHKEKLLQQLEKQPGDYMNSLHLSFACIALAEKAGF